MRRQCRIRRKPPAEEAEPCQRVNSILRDWRFELLPDGNLRLRQHPFGGVHRPSLVLAACFGVVAIGIQLFFSAALYPEGRWFLYLLLGGLGSALVLHAVSTVDYLAGDNFLEQRRYLCGLCWRRVRLLGASLEGVRLPGVTERWQLQASRKRIRIGSLCFGWSEVWTIGAVLSDATGWKLRLYAQDENGKREPLPSPFLATVRVRRRHRDSAPRKRERS